MTRSVAKGAWLVEVDSPLKSGLAVMCCARSSFLGITRVIRRACSGSDLRNLCMAAAMWPVRELASTLQERKDSHEGVSTSAAGAREPSMFSPSQWQLEGLEWSPKLRPIMQEDFDAALRQVRGSDYKRSNCVGASRKSEEKPLPSLLLGAESCKVSKRGP